MFLKYIVCVTLIVVMIKAQTNDTIMPQVFMFTTPLPSITTETMSVQLKNNFTTTTSRTISSLYFSNKTVPSSNGTNWTVHQSLLNNDLKQDGVNSYSQLSKFLVNSSQEVPIKTATNNGASSLSIMVISISLVAVAFVIAGIITALFVMKRRFSILRINGSKGDDGNNNDGAANGMLTTGSDSSSTSGRNSETVSTSDKCIEINEKEKEVLASALKEAATDEPELICVENKQAVMPVSANELVTVASVDSCKKVETIEADVANIGSNEELIPKEEKVVEAVGTDGVLIVPEGELVNTAVDSVEVPIITDMAVATTLPIETTTSSSSLIANVLNELSESVVSKLQASNDPEKQPLNLE
jgi:hypothetical protein